ncbi:unnamed protein product [Trichogramma brassicae]|uniref:Uncharacterized protein n=1 Tax=Trichogramma brassicae TaxID=86971 RepID=A0A6H5I606_9HYME|nr:unnamed protein product [Trichogramma brassicae]
MDTTYRAIYIYWNSLVQTRERRIRMCACACVHELTAEPEPRYSRCTTARSLPTFSLSLLERREKKREREPEADLYEMCLPSSDFCFIKKFFSYTGLPSRLQSCSRAYMYLRRAAGTSRETTSLARSEHTTQQQQQQRARLYMAPANYVCHNYNRPEAGAVAASAAQKTFFDTAGVPKKRRARNRLQRRPRRPAAAAAAAAAVLQHYYNVHKRLRERERERKRDDRMPAWARVVFAFVARREDRYSIVKRFSCNFSSEDYKASVVCQNLNSAPYDFFSRRRNTWNVV